MVNRQKCKERDDMADTRFIQRIKTKGMAHRWINLSLSLLLCTSANGYGAEPTPDSIPFTARYQVPDLDTVHLFENQKRSGIIHNEKIDEASGLVCGRKNKEVLYLVNDHGNENILWLIGPEGADKGAFYIKDLPDRDWEDIAIDYNDGGTPRIYIADIGDNALRYKEVFIYQVVEPDPPEDRHKISRLTAVTKYVMTYPDGAHNAETFFIDPLSKNWYIITKGVNAGVYTADYPQRSNDTIRLRHLGVLPFSNLTGGDIAPDGTELVLKNYKEIYYWRRQGIGETISQLLLRPPGKIPYVPEVHGESIGWTANGSGFFTTSEKRNDNPVIYFFKRK